jgi:hypothetical protein
VAPAAGVGGAAVREVQHRREDPVRVLRTLERMVGNLGGAG